MSQEENFALFKTIFYSTGLTFTIEAIAKYELISSTPFKYYQMLLITHLISLIFRAESNGSIFGIPQNHHQGAGGQVDQGQGGLHHVGGGVLQTI